MLPAWSNIILHYVAVEVWEGTIWHRFMLPQSLTCQLICVSFSTSIAGRACIFLQFFQSTFILLTLEQTLCRLFLKKNLELHIISSDAELKNEVLVADGIELPAFSEKW